MTTDKLRHETYSTLDELLSKLPKERRENIKNRILIGPFYSSEYTNLLKEQDENK